ncbi:MAG: hypothetical protein IPK60_22450 [Sandaracinaceae bacterium]|nr:hypothetical protein [Sandaracinaceae bacterium]
MKKNAVRAEYVTRDTILRLLSDEELARVCTAEAGTQLVDGDEYVDLETPNRGVRIARASGNLSIVRVLPRKAVHERTWRRILALLSAHEARRLHSLN